MKQLIFLPLLLLACATAAAPSEGSAGEAARASAQAARAGTDAAQAGGDAARAADDDARAGDEAARRAADAQKLAELQAHMNDLAQRMAELSMKIGDQASASALRYLADGNRGMLGIAVDPDDDGMHVEAVTPGGPAERAGLKAGDVITAINGKHLSWEDASLLNGLSDLPPGKPVRLAVLRDGRTLQFHVTPERFQAADWQALARTAQAAAQKSLAKLDSPEFRKQLDRNIEQAMKQTEKARAQIATQWGKNLALNGRWFAPWWGLNLASLNPQLGHYFGTDSGALVLSVDDKSYPGLESGDVITAVDGHAVEKPGDVMRALQSLPADATAHLEVVRRGKQVALNFKVPARGYPFPPPPPAPPAPPAAPDAPPAPPAPPSPPTMSDGNASPAQSPRGTNDLADFEHHAGPSQRNMHYFRLDNFQYLGKNKKGEDAIAVWTDANQVSLLTLQEPCINLDTALAIGLTSTSGDVNAGMDYVKYDRNGPHKCRITSIRKVDYKAMRGS